MVFCGVVKIGICCNVVGVGAGCCCCCWAWGRICWSSSGWWSGVPILGILNPGLGSIWSIVAISLCHETISLLLNFRQKVRFHMSNYIAPLQVTLAHTSTDISYLPSFVAIFASCASGAIRRGWWESHVTNIAIMKPPLVYLNQCFLKVYSADSRERRMRFCKSYSVRIFNYEIPIHTKRSRSFYLGQIMQCTVTYGNSM